MFLGKSVLSASLVVSLLSAASLATADESSRESRFAGTIYTGLTFGGDDLATVDYIDDDGDDVYSDDVQAGGLLVLGGGISYTSSLPYELRATAGYHWDSADADDGSIDFERTVFDFLAFYAPGKHRVGGGLTYHTNINFEAKADYSGSVEVEYEDEVGFMLEYDYVFTRWISVGVRYTFIDYTPEKITYTNCYYSCAYQSADQDVSADHVGIMANVFF